jgi:outer membrane protein insertion porin family
MSYFHHTYHRRNTIGLHFQVANITGYGGKDVPPFNRFYLGGENDVRGFDFYTIAPFVAIPNSTATSITYLDPTRLDSRGNPTLQALTVPVLLYVPTRPGGDTQFVTNFEYRIPIAGPVTVALFNDLGLDGILRKSQLELNPSSVSLLQEQYPNPDFPNLNVTRQLSIISGTNFHPHTSAGIEFGVFLPVVNAPFRFYYAYNYLRLNQTIVGNRGGYYLSDLVKETLPPGVLESQIAPELNTFLDQQVQRIPAGLLEPKQTFRFTVGRTF